MEAAAVTVVTAFGGWRIYHQSRGKKKVVSIEATSADVAATALSAPRTLERYGLDYCCGGSQPFDQACAVHIHLENNILFPRAVALEHSQK